ncbi:MAG TPA: 30S ribosome-binding factor RbfA [Polyangiaceae bacterium]|jgi:ribosome-binding factor A|nr:30S ribosome-binding factor RbfA [Polyangiaceae bacterium]
MQSVTPKRAVRVAERVREEVARALARDLDDPRLALAVITRVEMPDDLGVAKVMVRLATGGEDEAARKRLLAGLSAASGLLRKQVGQNVGLRRAPELRFFYDEGQDASTRVEELLEEIARKAKNRTD